MCGGASPVSVTVVAVGDANPTGAPSVGDPGAAEPVARRTITSARSASLGLTHVNPSDDADAGTATMPVTGAGAVRSISGAGGATDGGSQGVRPWRHLGCRWGGDGPRAAGELAGRLGPHLDLVRTDRQGQLGGASLIFLLAVRFLFFAVRYLICALVAFEVIATNTLPEASTV